MTAYLPALGTTAFGRKGKIMTADYIPFKYAVNLKNQLHHNNYTPDATSLYTDTIVRKVISESNGAQRGQYLIEALDKLGKSFGKDTQFYKDTHSIELKEGGYLLTRSFNDESVEEISRMLDIGGGLSDKIVQIINPGDYKAMMKRRGLKTLKAQYKNVFGKDYLGIKRKKDKTGKEIETSLTDKQQIKEIVNALADVYTLGSDAYQAMAKNNKEFAEYSLDMHRSPTIQGQNDIISGGLLLSDIVSSGNYLVNPAFLAMLHGDFDGDTIALSGIMSEYSEEDFEYLKARATIINKIIKEHREDYTKKPDKTTGKISKLEELFNQEAQLGKEAGMSAGKKGAGIFGNEVKVAIDKAYAGFDEQQRKRGDFFTKTVAALYQEGINIKNTVMKEDENEGESIITILDSIFENIGSASM